MKIFSKLQNFVTTADCKKWVMFFFLLALVLRLWQNTISPPSPYWEEVALGYDAYSVLKTGADRLGNRWPLVAFTSFGDYKPSLYFYTLLPAIKLLGLSTFAVRLPAAIFSAGSVAITYLLAKQWFKDPVAWWSALLLSFQPWSWQVGRAGFEVNLAVFLIVAAVYLLTLSLKSWTQKPSISFWWLSVSSAILFSLSMYAYHGARLLAPLMAASIVLIYFLQTSKKKSWSSWFHWLPSLGVAMLLIVPILLVLAQPVVSQRFTETSVFTLLDPINQSNTWRNLAGNSLLARIAFHRYWFWGNKLLQNYWSHFSPTFLFGLAESNVRHLSGYLGALYPWELLTIMAGLASLRTWSKNNHSWHYLLALILITPLASTLTKTNPHALRTLPLAVWMAVLSAVGLVQIKNLISHLFSNQVQIKKTITLLSLATVIISWSFLWHYMRWQYPIQHSSAWQYGYQELYQQLDKIKNPVEPVYVSRQQGRPAMYLFFMQKIDPQRVQKVAAADQTLKDQQELLVFENWHFNEDRSSTGLHAAAPADVPSDNEIITTIKNLNQQDIWAIYRVP